jgi:hypothetical protein
MQGANGSQDGRITQISRGPRHEGMDGSPVRCLLSERLRTCNVLELLSLKVDCHSLGQGSPVLRIFRGCDCLVP